jgi:hypothetical protein
MKIRPLATQLFYGNRQKGRHDEAKSVGVFYFQIVKGFTVQVITT